MARRVPIHVQDPPVRTRAEAIIAGQSTETAAMQARLDSLRHVPNGDPDGFPALHGTRNPQQSDSWMRERMNCRCAS